MKLLDDEIKKSEKTLEDIGKNVARTQENMKIINLMY